MKALKQALAVAILSAMPILSAQPAPAWYDVEINMAGMSANGTLFIRVTDLAANPAFTNLWLIGNPSLAREMLATSLAAMTNDMVAFVNTDPGAGGFPLANNLYLKK